MRYISEVEFRKMLSGLLVELSKTSDSKQKRKLQDEINALKKLRDQSIQEERFMSGRR